MPSDKYILQNRIRMCNEYSRYLSQVYGIINPPEVKILPYSRFGKCVILGCYDSDDNTITMNKYVLLGGNLCDHRTILQHELVHALSYQRFGYGGHGAHFNRMCEEFQMQEDCKRAVSR